MEKVSVPICSLRSRQIVGFSLPLELAVAVKEEATRRNFSLRKFFVEMWAIIYKKNNPSDPRVHYACESQQAPTMENGHQPVC